MKRGDRVRCVRTFDGAQREVGWEGHVITEDPTCAMVKWDNGVQTWVSPPDIEFMHSVKVCPGCEEPKPDPEFEDYLCKSCRGTAPTAEPIYDRLAEQA